LRTCTKIYVGVQLLVILLFTQNCAFAKQGGNATVIESAQVTWYILPGNYSLEQIVADSTLPFVKKGDFQPSANSVYWVKMVINNPGRISGSFNLFAHPSIANTTYYFDENAQQWVSHSGGVDVNLESIRNRIGAMHFVLNSGPVNVLYIKMNLAWIKNTKRVTPRFAIEENAETNRQQDALLYSWVAALSVLFFFFLYNLYLYGSFKDASILYYLIAQVGAMVYITAYRLLFKFFFAGKVYTIGFQAGRGALFYDMNMALQHIGIMLIMFGLVQLTRSYLNTARNLPRADRLLKYGLYFYLAASAVLIIINSLVLYFESYTLLYDNLFLMLLVSLIIYACVLAYRRKLRAAGPFLLANVLPLVFIIFVTLFHIFVSFDTVSDTWLPVLAIVSQAFCFSVALVARTRAIQNDLRAKEMEAQQLSFENEKITISIQVEKTRNELLQERLEYNQRELASTTLYMVQKNEMLATLRSQIEELNRLYPKNPHGKLSGIESILQSNLYLDEDWQKFKLHFEQVHPGFFENLQATHPNLSKNDMRLCAYFQMNLSNKEVATLLNIAPDSVRKAKARLQKKMGITGLPEDAFTHGEAE